MVSRYNRAIQWIANKQRAKGFTPETLLRAKLARDESEADRLCERLVENNLAELDDKNGQYWATLDSIDKLAESLPEESPSNGRHQDETKYLDPEPEIESYCDILAREITWAWQYRLPLGRLSIVSGRPGIGKSFLTCDLAARVSRGMPMPDGNTKVQGDVILISCEDDPRDTTRPRLDAACADVKRVHRIKAKLYRNDDGTIDRQQFTLQDVPVLEKAFQRFPNCRLAVIDPIGSYLGGGTDSYRDNEVRSVLAPISDLAERYGPAVLLVAHHRKGRGGSADDLILGSTAFTALCRTSWHIVVDPDNPARRLFVPGKNNLAPPRPGLAFTLDGSPIPSVTWDDQPVNLTASEAVSQEHDEDDHRSALDEACEYLRSVLAQGPELQDQIKKNIPLGVSQRTLRRAKKKLSVTAGPRGGIGGPWEWRLPE